jgi:hypothetical protein
MYPQTRSILTSPPRPGFPEAGRVRDQNPLPESRPGYPDPSAGIHSPPGLSPLGIEVLYRYPSLETYRDGPPDLSSLPAGIAC